MIHINECSWDNLHSGGFSPSPPNRSSLHMQTDDCGTCSDLAEDLCQITGRKKQVERRVATANTDDAEDAHANVDDRINRALLPLRVCTLSVVVPWKISPSITCLVCLRVEYLVCSLNGNIVESQPPPMLRLALIGAEIATGKNPVLMIGS